MSKEQILIKLDTMGTSQKSAIVSIAAVRFDLVSDSINCFYSELDWQDQLREIDPLTKKWWSEDFNSKRAACLEGLDDLGDTLKRLDFFIMNCRNIWAARATFDIAILQNAYEQLNRELPFKFHDVYDVPTLLKCYEMSRGGLRQGLRDQSAETALDTAKYQAKEVKTMLKSMQTPKS